MHIVARIPSLNQTKFLNEVSDCYSGSSFSTTAVYQEVANPSIARGPLLFVVLKIGNLLSDPQN